MIIGGDKDCQHNLESKERYLHRGTTKSSKLTKGHITEAMTSYGICIHCNAWKGVVQRQEILSWIASLEVVAH